MSSREFSTVELEAYLHEALPPNDMAAIETALRNDPELLKQLSLINNRRDAGVHTLGDVWRRHRISCPTREQLGSYLLGALGQGHGEYIAFHIDKIGCRICRANLEDLQRQQGEAAQDASQRRRKYFQSSAGYLGEKRE